MHSVIDKAQIDDETTERLDQCQSFSARGGRSDKGSNHGLHFYLTRQGLLYPKYTGLSVRGRSVKDSNRGLRFFSRQGLLCL